MRAIRRTDAKRRAVVEELGSPRITQPGRWIPDMGRLGTNTVDLDNAESLAAQQGRQRGESYIDPSEVKARHGGRDPFHRPHEQRCHQSRRVLEDRSLAVIADEHQANALTL